MEGSPPLRRRSNEWKFFPGADQILLSTSDLTSLTKEFTELGRSRERVGEDAAAAAFFSCASRLSEVLQNAINAPATPKPQSKES